MSKIKLAGKSISEILKRIKRAKRNKKATQNQEKAGLSTKSIKPFNYRAGARNEQIVPVKKQSQTGSSFQPHRVRGKQGAASIKETSEGSAASWRDEMDKYFGDLRPSKFFKKASGGDINTGMKKLSPKQKAIAAKAPPPDKIDAKDFAVLKAEKAKGRGMGLQDEKIKPGKVMTARDGKAIKADPTKTITDKGQFVKRRMKLAGSKLPGRIGTALGIGAMMVPAAYAAAKQYKDYKSAKNRDEAKVKKYSVGGGADTGRRTYSSMEEMRTAKGFKPGETPAQFNKRKAAMEVAKKAAKATRIGKIVLPIAAAGVAGAAYLKNKLKKEDKKMGGGMAKKYSTGMTLADMKPYGGSYVKKKAEMKASQTENVKKLTTSDDAYSPERMFVVTQGRQKGNSSTPSRIRVTDDLNARRIADTQNELNKGKNIRSFATYKLPPAYQRDYERRQQVLQNMANRKGYSGPTKKMPSRRINPSLGPKIPKHKSGVMVKVKLGRNKPTKIC